MADQMAYTGTGHEDAPSIDDVKALQASIGRRDYHIVWLGDQGFVMAHTDEERATIDLETCELHKRLMDADESPVNQVGYYMYLPAHDEFALLTVPDKAGDGAS
jgi:hypothetical protein